MIIHGRTLYSLVHSTQHAGLAGLLRLYRRRLAIPQHAVHLANVVRHLPRTVVLVDFNRGQQRPLSYRRRSRGKRPQLAKAAKRYLREVFRQPVDIIDANRAGGCEITLVSKVWALTDVDGFHQLGDQEIDIGICRPRVELLAGEPDFARGRRLEIGCRGGTGARSNSTQGSRGGLVRRDCWRMLHAPLTG
jgi:hypothetical protein